MIDRHMNVLTEMTEYVEEHIPYAQMIAYHTILIIKQGEVICKLLTQRNK